MPTDALLRPGAKTSMHDESPWLFVDIDTSTSTKAHHRRRRLALQRQEQTTDQPLDTPNYLTYTPEVQHTAPASSREQNPEQPATGSAVWKFLSVSPATKPDEATRRAVRSHVTKQQHRRHRKLWLQHGADEHVQNDPSDRILPDPKLLHALEDPTDKLDVYARQLETNGPTLWAHYLWQEREHGRLFYAQNERFRGWGPKYLHPLILNDKAMLASTVLFTGCLLRQRAGKAVFSLAILQLQSLAYNLVQHAIDSPETQLSDTTILAVIKMALFEAIFGHREAYETHMRGVMQMISLRNGLSNLGMGGYLAALLLWFDANLASVTKSSRHLAGLMSDEDVEAARPDSDLFTLGIELSEKSDILQ